MVLGLARSQASKAVGMWVSSAEGSQDWTEGEERALLRHVRKHGFPAEEAAVLRRALQAEKAAVRLGAAPSAGSRFLEELRKAEPPEARLWAPTASVRRELPPPTVEDPVVSEVVPAGPAGLPPDRWVEPSAGQAEPMPLRAANAGVLVDPAGSRPALPTELLTEQEVVSVLPVGSDMHPHEKAVDVDDAGHADLPDNLRSSPEGQDVWEVVVDDDGLQREAEGLETLNPPLLAGFPPDRRVEALVDAVQQLSAEGAAQTAVIQQLRAEIDKLKRISLAGVQQRDAAKVSRLGRAALRRRVVPRRSGEWQAGAEAVLPDAGVARVSRPLILKAVGLPEGRTGVG